jgi:hypothetical protein
VATDSGSPPCHCSCAVGPERLHLSLGVFGTMSQERSKYVTLPVFISLNLALAAAIVLMLAVLPRTANVSDSGFLLVCSGAFASFYLLSRLANMVLMKALLWAGICSFITLVVASVIAMAVHGIGPCL